MSPSNIPLTIRARIIERKLANLENELADIASHMSALPGPGWERRTRQLRKASKLLTGWRKKL